MLNLIVPGPPWRNLVMSWAADYSPSSSSGSGTHSRGQTPKGSVAGRCGIAFASDGHLFLLCHHPSSQCAQPFLSYTAPTEAS